MSVIKNSVREERNRKLVSITELLYHLLKAVNIALDFQPVSISVVNLCGMVK